MVPNVTKNSHPITVPYITLVTPKNGVNMYERAILVTIDRIVEIKVTFRFPTPLNSPCKGTPNPPSI